MIATTLTELEAILITCLPALTSIISVISVAITIVKNLKTLKDNQELRAERDALMEQNQLMVDEMKKSQKMLALFIEKAAHVVYGDLSEVQNDKDLQI